MADPLSITASIIAVVGAAEGIANTFAKIKDIRHAPFEILALMNEVSDLKIVLETVQRSIDRSRLPRGELLLLAGLIQKAKDKLLQLDNLIHYRLLKPESGVNEIKVSYRAWVRAKSTIQNFRQSFRDIRLDIVTHMVLVNRYEVDDSGLKMALDY